MRLCHLRSALMGLVSTAVLVSSAAAAPVALDGTWRFALDANDAGVKETWWKQTLADKIQLPGCLQAQGFGNAVTVDTPWTGQIVDQSWFQEPRYEKYRRPGNVKVPFWLQPERHYVGAAWYQRDVEIPEAWNGKRVVLEMERPHWETRAWLDDKELGSCDSLSTAHVYELGDVAPGKHRLTVRIDNRLIQTVGVNAHSVTDHTQSNWNGIVGRIALMATDRLWIDDVQVYPNAAKKSATVKVRVRAGKGVGGAARLTLSTESYNAAKKHKGPKASADFRLAGSEAEVTCNYTFDKGAQLWDEFQPALYRLTADVETAAPAGKLHDQKIVSFGMRDFRAAGTQFTINGRKTFLRGTLECCIFPKTGYPPTDVAEWKRILAACRAHGLNHMRFHSWCPPEAAFVAADEMGFYYHVECAVWVNSGPTIGDGAPIDKWIYAEGDRILKAYGNHPSFVLLNHGNEPAGKKQKEYLGQLVSYWKKSDNRHLYGSGSGWPAIPENQWECTPHPRIQAWGGGLKSRINARPPETTTDYADHVKKIKVPIVSHEIGQWCVYPNFDEIAKYTGYLKPKNFEIFRETLAANSLGDQARAFLLASGKLQTLCYKEEIESALRTPGFGGFELLDLHDFPGQGTALVGVLDPFWEGKGYVTPEQYSRFCNSTVPLARIAKRVWTTADRLTADIEVAHFGPAPLKGVTPVWKLVNDEGRVVEYGRLNSTTIPIGNGTALGKVAFDLKEVPAPAKYRLVVDLENTPFENDWDLWVYPAQVDATVPADVLVTRKLDEAALARLSSGGKVLVLLNPAEVKSPVAIGFSSIFWNTAWTRGQAPHTLGIVCDPKHPVFASFPTDNHSNWQWWELIHGSSALVLDGLPSGLRPLVQPIDTWFENRRLGLLVEARVGDGKLIVSSMDLSTDLDKRPAARQLLRSLLGYMSSPAFAPTQGVEASQLQRVCAGT